MEEIVSNAFSRHTRDRSAKLGSVGLRLLQSIFFACDLDTGSRFLHMHQVCFFLEALAGLLAEVLAGECCRLLAPQTK